MTMPAQLSTGLRTFAAEDPGDWSSLVEFARAADEAGVDRLVLSDHVVFGENLDAYGDPANGGSRGGKQPTGPDGAWLDPITTIAHLTAVTTRVRFATNILIAALRRPVVLAKMAATIDVLSKGRIDLGVGVGWQREEYEAAGLSFEGRGRLLNHTIEVCQTLWRNETANYETDELSFSHIHQMPKPTQPGGVPIWVSGTVNGRSMDRLGSVRFRLDSVGRRRGGRRGRDRPHAGGRGGSGSGPGRHRRGGDAGAGPRRRQERRPGPDDGIGSRVPPGGSHRLPHQSRSAERSGRPHRLPGRGRRRFPVRQRLSLGEGRRSRAGAWVD